MANIPEPDRAAMYSNVLFLAGKTRFADLTINTTGDQTAALPGGFYDVWAQYDFHVNVSASNALTGFNTTTGYRALGNYQPITVFVPDQGKIAGIAVSTNTVLSGMKVS